MYQLVDEIINIDYEELSTFEIPIDYRFGLCVTLRNTKYEFLVYFKSNTDKVLCLGSGAMGDDSKHDTSRPFFHRHSWTFDASTIWYNDPTRYLNLESKGSWGVGTTDDYILENIGDILVQLITRMNLKRENIIFYGSSMGGFTSLQLATMVKDSIALADIPQLEFQNHVSYERVKPYCFPGLSDEEIWNRFKHRFDVIELMKKEDYIPKAIIVFNCSNRDINTQYLDFIKKINVLPTITNNKNRIKIVFNYIDRHAPLSNEESLEFANGVTSKNLMAYIDEIKDSELYNDNLSLKSEKEELNNEIAELKNEISQLKDEISENKRNIIELSRKLVDYSDEINQNNIIIENQNDNLKKQKDELTAIKSTKTWIFHQKIDNLRQKI